MACGFGAGMKDGRSVGVRPMIRGAGNHLMPKGTQPCGEAKIRVEQTLGFDSVQTRSARGTDGVAVTGRSVHLKAELRA